MYLRFMFNRMLSLLLIITLFAFFLPTYVFGEGISTDNTDASSVKSTEENEEKSDDKKNSSDPWWIRVLSITLAPILSFFGAVVGVKHQTKERKAKAKEESFIEAYDSVLCMLYKFKKNVRQNTDYDSCYKDLIHNLDQMTGNVIILNARLPVSNNINTLANNLSIEKLDYTNANELTDYVCKTVDDFIEIVTKVREQHEF